MPEGLDFTLADKDGYSFRYIVSMQAAFASITVAEELDKGDYPTLAPVWDYRSTPVPHDTLPTLRLEHIQLTKAVQRARVDQVVIDELDELNLYLQELERLGFGVHVAGP
jgi:hypothetical protein